MASGALFGGSGSRSQSKNLVEFRAGKMKLSGKMVTPDKRKGLVYIHQSDDSLMHFCWKDRTTGTVEDDLIIFPDDIEFKRVPQCTTGRVYILKFKSSSRKFFFWMQEPKTDKDEEYCKKVNESLNNPPTPGANRGGSSGGLGGLPPELATGLGEGELQNLLGNMSQQQLMQLLGGMGMGGLGGLSALMGGRSGSSHADSTPPSRVQSSPGPRSTTADSGSAEQRPVTAAALPTPSANTPSSQDQGKSGDNKSQGSSTGIQLSDLQNILSGMGATETPRENVDLASAMTPETIIPLLANPDLREKLLPFLPEGEGLPKSEEELRNTISSPQFQQAMGSFTAALASGQLGPLMKEFGLGEDVANAAAQGDVEAFAKALQGQEDKKKEAKDEDKDEDGDQEMKDEEQK